MVGNATDWSYTSNPDRSRGKRQTVNDASMDDILSSIRKIIDEEPLAARFQVRPTTDQTISGGGFPGTDTRAAAKSVRRSTQRAVPADNLDEVLAELLEPTSAPKSIGEPRETSGQSLSAAERLPLVPARSAVAEAPAVGPDNASDLPPVERVVLLPAPPDVEVQAAADVLSALALGLATGADEKSNELSVDCVFPAHEIISKTSSDTPAACIELDQNIVVKAASELFASSAETAAAAVAEVAAANVANAALAMPNHSDGAALQIVRDPTSTNDAPAAVELSGPASDVSTSVEAGDACGVEAMPETVVAGVALQTASEIHPPICAPAIPSAIDPDVAPAKSFEETIAAMLRPLLREWLDANMPRMVDKALRQELSEVAELKSARSAASLAKSA